MTLHTVPEGVRSSLIRYLSVSSGSDDAIATIDSKDDAVGVMVKVVGEDGRGSGAEWMTVIVVISQEEEWPLSKFSDTYLVLPFQGSAQALMCFGYVAKLGTMLEYISFLPSCLFHMS